MSILKWIKDLAGILTWRQAVAAQQTQLEDLARAVRVIENKLQGLHRVIQHPGLPPSMWWSSSDIPHQPAVDTAVDTAEEPRGNTELAAIKREDKFLYDLRQTMEILEATNQREAPRICAHCGCVLHPAECHQIADPFLSRKEDIAAQLERVFCKPCFDWLTKGPRLE